MSNWKRSGRCGTTTCVEVGKMSDGSVLVRDSKNPDHPPLAFTFDEWRDFLQGVRDGDFDS